MLQWTSPALVFKIIQLLSNVFCSSLKPLLLSSLKIEQLHSLKLLPLLFWLHSNSFYSSFDLVSSSFCSWFELCSYAFPCSLEPLMVSFLKPNAAVKGHLLFFPLSSKTFCSSFEHHLVSSVSWLLSYDYSSSKLPIVYCACDYASAKRASIYVVGSSTCYVSESHGQHFCSSYQIPSFVYFNPFQIKSPPANLTIGVCFSAVKGWSKPVQAQ